MSDSIKQLLAIMAQLRNPQGGCPWDLEQTFATIAPHTLEEAYEVVEAIEKQDMAALKDELGDLLFQVVFHAQLAAELKLFSFDDIAAHVTAKMVERHPHVFGDRNAATAGDVVTNWEADKAAKREAAARAENRPSSVLDGVNTALPGMTRAVKLQKRAARVGFDWTDQRDVIAKIHEELAELQAELEASTPSHAAITDELGDVLFAITNLARHLDIDPETALRHTNAKFERRFREVERRLASSGRDIKAASLDEMEATWVEIKQAEKR
jgi:ATP diphosphatase